MKGTTMNRMMFGSIAAAATLLAGVGAANAADGKEVLEKATKAHGELKTVAFESLYFVDVKPEALTSGAFVHDVPTFKAKVKMLRNSDGKMMARVDGVRANPETNEISEYMYVTDGAKLGKTDAMTKKFTHGAFPEAQMMYGPGWHPTIMAFADTPMLLGHMQEMTVGHDGTRELDGTGCDLVTFTDSDWPGKLTMWIGSDDHLIRRYEMTMDTEEGKRAMVALVRNVDLNPGSFEEALFAMTAPEGYEAVAFEMPKQREQAPLLAVGSDAPDWTLTTPEGAEVTLSDLKGTVVVMDFWATWCGPCKRAMPGLQKVHEHFAGQPVKVFGINCWERGDPKKYMDDQGFTYGLLLGADDVAAEYKVSGIPTFYIIGKDGKVFHTEVGFNKDGEEELKTKIQEALEG